MLAKLRLVFIVLLSNLLFSCSQKHENKRLVSHTSFQWSEKVDSLLNDSTKSSTAILALKRTILLTSSDTQAINKLAVLSDSLTDEVVYAIGDDIIKHSKSINYPLGMVYGIEQKGLQFTEDNKYDSANACFVKGLALATKIGNEKVKGRLIYRYGVVAYFESKYDTALEKFNKALTIGDSINDAKLSADCLYKIGETDRYTYNYFDALGYFNRAIQAAYEIADTERVRQCLQSVGDVYRLQAVYPTALYYYTQCLNMAKAAGEKQRVDQCLYSIGEVYQQQADNIKALDYFNQSIAIAKEIDDQAGIAACLSSLATIYTLEADFVKALEYHNQAIKIEKEEGDDGDLAYSYVGMGDIYRQEKDFTNALSSYKMGISIAQKTVDKTLYNTSLNLIGEVYREEGNTAEALNYYNQVITLAQKIQDDDNLSTAYYNMGKVYSVLLDNKEAMEYYQKSLDIARANKANHMIAECLYGLGEIYVKTGDVQKAKEYATESLKAAQISNEPAGIQNAAKLLSQANKQLGDFKTALDMNELFVKMKDSISNVEEIKKFSTVEYKSKEDQLKSEEEKTTAVLKAEAGKNEAELKRQKTIRYAFTVGFLLVLLFSGLIYRGLQKSKKQTLIIGQQKTEVELQRTFAEQQKALVDEKNKEIIDSITYAKRLQDAILPPIQQIEEHLPDSFILYKPKAIVAGDFYWMEKNGDEILLAAADCTGHGVPGAMVSVVCSNALNSAVKEFNLKEPGEILDKVRELVVETFDRSGSDVKDGMDISLCSLNIKTREMKWSGANNPLWYIQNNELKEIRPDKQPIGIHDKVKPFTTHHIKLSKGDTVYLFSDGYADQFGGDKGKKFKYRQIQTKIMEFATASLKEQGDVLHNAFEEWKGMLEQVDDVLMIGIRV